MSLSIGYAAWCPSSPCRKQKSRQSRPAPRRQAFFRLVRMVHGTATRSENNPKKPRRLPFDPFVPTDGSLTASIHYACVPAGARVITLRQVTIVVGVVVVGHEAKGAKAIADPAEPVMSAVPVMS